MTVSAVLISTVVSCLASYSIARLPLRGAMFWRLLFVGGLIVPVQLIMVAIFIIMRWLGLLGSLGSLILVYSTFGIPLGVLVLVGFFQALPQELTEAATIDGATDFQTFRRIILPLSMAPILTVMILNGVWIWNDFFIALVLSTKPSIETLPLGILNFFGVYSTEWGLIFASVVLVGSARRGPVPADDASVHRGHDRRERQGMKITEIDTVVVDGGMRNWVLVLVRHGRGSLPGSERRRSRARPRRSWLPSPSSRA